MKELVCFDIFYDKLDCTNATQHCKDREPGSYCRIKELHWKATFGVLGHSSHFQIYHRREDKIQWSEPNCATDGHKVPKKGHSRSNKSHVNGSENKSDKVFSQGEMASSFAGQHFFPQSRHTLACNISKRKNSIKRGIEFMIVKNMTNAEPREEVIIKMWEDASIKTWHCKNFAWQRKKFEIQIMM